MNYLVTGAGGFIGAVVLRRLLYEDARVLAVTSRGPTLRHPRLTWVSADLLEASTSRLESMLRGQALSHCIHCAWYTQHADYLTHEVNRAWVDASIRLAEAFQACGGRRFIGLGSCLEYRTGGALEPCSENRTPLGGSTFYAQCKQLLAGKLSDQLKDFAWARVFFVYGPGDRAGRFIPALLQKLAAGEAFEPRCGGLQRDYIHVDDLAGQIVRIAGADVQGPVNTGTGEALTLSEIVASAAQLLGRPELAGANARLCGEPQMIAADLTKFRSAVGGPRARPIAEGLGAMISS